MVTTPHSSVYPDTLGTNNSHTYGIETRWNMKCLLGHSWEKLSFWNDIGNVFSLAENIVPLSDILVAFYSPSKKWQSFCKKVENVLAASNMLEYRNSVYVVNITTGKVLTFTTKEYGQWERFDISGWNNITRWTKSGDYFSIDSSKIKDGNFPPIEDWHKWFTDL